MTRKKRILEKRMYIFCEGEKTEPNYLEGYILHYAKQKANIIEIPDINCNTPIALVNEAISIKHSKFSTPNDEFWVVYDRESVSKYSNSLHKQAREHANKHGINIALSNICFEFWLLQHFRYHNKPFSSYHDLIKNSSLKADLKKFGINNYDKGCTHLFSKLKEHVNQARINAKQLNRESMESASKKMLPHELSSYTDVYLLLDAIDAFELK